MPGIAYRIIPTLKVVHFPDAGEINYALQFLDIFGDKQLLLERKTNLAG